MPLVTSAYRSFGYLKGFGAVVSGLAVMGLMLYIVVDVILRTFFGSTLPASIEISENYLMPLSIFPALAWVYSSGVFPRMELFAHRLARSTQNILIYALLGLEILLVAFITYFSWGYAMTAMGQSTAFSAGGALFPVWPFYFLVPIGFGLFLIELLFVLHRNVSSNEPPVLIMEHAEERPTAETEAVSTT